MHALIKIHFVYLSPFLLSAPLSWLWLFNGNRVQILTESVSNYITKQMSMDPTDVVSLMSGFGLLVQFRQPPLDGIKTQAVGFWCLISRHGCFFPSQDKEMEHIRQAFCSTVICSGFLLQYAHLGRVDPEIPDGEWCACLILFSAMWFSHMACPAAWNEQQPHYIYVNSICTHVNSNSTQLSAVLHHRHHQTNRYTRMPRFNYMSSCQCCNKQAGSRLDLPCLAKMSEATENTHWFTTEHL